MKCDEFPLKSMAYLDDEMEPGDREAFEYHVAMCDRCRAELEKLRRVKEMTGRIKMVDVEEQRWETYWAQIYNRLERMLGWILLSIGAIITFSYGLFTAMKDLLYDSSVPVLLRFGIFALVIGLVILLVSVARQRFFAWKRDPYREVRR